MKSWSWWASLALAVSCSTASAQMVPPSPSGEMAMPRANGNGAPRPVVDSNGQGNGDCNSCTSCEAEEPFRLFKSCCGWQLRGWVNASSTANWDNPASRFNGPVTFVDRSLGTLNQAYAILEKPLNIEDDCCWDAGARVDVLFGSDYIFTQAAGLETRRDYSPKWNDGPDYGLALPQAYGEVGIGKLSLKLGHFYTTIGNETVMAPDNFFVSHAYTMQYGEPFTHTGGLLTYKQSDSLTFTVGLVNGWDKLDAQENEVSVLSGVTWTGCDGKYSLSFNLITGDEDGALQLLGNRTMYSFVGKFKATEKLEYVLQHDHGWQDLPNGAAVQWYGLNQYLLYTINDCWKAGVRGEWFRDDGGFRVSGLRAGNPMGFGYSGNYSEVAAGLNWKPHKNVTIRQEVRWDWFDGAGPFGSRPFNDRTSGSQFISTVDAIVVW